MSSVLQNLQAERDERTQDIHLDLPVPTWDNNLVARFVVMSEKDQKDFSKRRQDPANDLDFLIRTLDSLWVYDPNQQQPGERMEENKEYVRLDNEQTGMPLKFDLALAQALNLPATDPREVVKYMFKGNLVSISAMVQRIGRWMVNTDAEASSAILGE